MRGLVDGLQSPHPLERSLPAVFMEERPFAAETANGSEAVPMDVPPGTYTAAIEEADLGAAASEARVGLAGSWMLRVVAVPADSTQPHALSVLRDGETVTAGTLAFSDDVASVRTGDCGPSEGRYRWRFDGSSLRLDPIEDACAQRQALLAARPWLHRSFATRFVSAFDDALAPVFSVLDNLDAYVDPRLAPADFVDWLSGWVGLSPSQKWPLRRRRDRIARAVQLALTLGTVEGITEVVSIFTGVEPAKVTISESGGVASSPTSGGELPGSPEPHLSVRVKVSDPSAFDIELLRRVVAAAKPAHMPHEVEVVKE